MTRISIITAVRNGAATIADALASLAEQSVPCEHLLVDGASTDATVAIVRRLSPSSRIISEPDHGIYDALNKGIAMSTGEVIGILHASDLFASSLVLERVAALFADPTVDACYTDLEYVKDSPSHSSPFTVVRYWKAGGYTPQSWYRGWMPPHPTFFCRRTLFERLGFYDLSLGTAADYELMLRFMLRYGVRTAYIPEVLVRMRVGGASNESLSARFKANRMDRRAWEVNGLKPSPWTLICKPLRKAGQYVHRR